MAASRSSPKAGHVCRRATLGLAIVFCIGAVAGWGFFSDILGWMFPPTVLAQSFACPPVVADSPVSLLTSLLRVSLCCGALALTVPTAILSVAALEGRHPRVSARDVALGLTGLVVLAATIAPAPTLVTMLSTLVVPAVDVCDVKPFFEWRVSTLSQGLVGIALPVQAIVVAAFYPRIFLEARKLKILIAVFLLAPAACSLALGLGDARVHLVTGAVMVACLLLAVGVAKLASMISSKRFPSARL